MFLFNTRGTVKYFFLLKRDHLIGQQSSLSRAFGTKLCKTKFKDPYIHQRYKNNHELLQVEKEAGVAQMEVGFDYSDCLTTADRTAFFKFMVKVA